MEVSYLLTAVIAYLGLLAGMIVSYLAREELREGEKYFVIMQHTLLFLFAVIALSTGQVLVAISVVALLIMAHRITISYLMYPLLAILLFSTQTLHDRFLTAALIFIYGLPTAALDYKRGLRPLIYNAGFLVFSLMFLLTG
jgi:hypothetical protein